MIQASIPLNGEEETLDPVEIIYLDRLDEEGNPIVVIDNGYHEYEFPLELFFKMKFSPKETT